MNTMASDSNTLKPNTKRSLSLLFFCVVISLFLMYWLVGIPILWTVFYLYSEDHNWHPHWHIYYWISALIIWCFFLVLLLIYVTKRGNLNQDKKMKLIEDKMLKERNAWTKESELSVLDNVKQANVSDAVDNRKRLNTERLKKVEEQKTLTSDLCKSYSSLNDNKNIMLNTQSSKVKQILGYEDGILNKKFNRPHEKVNNDAAINSRSNDVSALKVEKRKTFHFTAEKRTSLQSPGNDINRCSFPQIKNINQPHDSNSPPSQKESVNTPVLTREDSYKGLPNIEKFDSYLKLVTIDSPQSPRELFFSELIAAANEEDKQKSIVDDSIMTKEKSNEDEYVFSDSNNSNQSEYFVADIRPRPPSITTEAFIIIDAEAEHNKRVSKTFVVKDNKLQE